MRKGATLAQKILSYHLGREVKVGEIISIPVDLIFAHDGTAPLAIQTFYELPPLEENKLASHLILFIDHGAPAPNSKISNLQQYMRQFAQKYGINLYDWGEGISHLLLIEEGYVLPGKIILGGDSHTTTLGAIAAFACGVGSTDLAITMRYGKTWIRVPPTIKIILEGNLSFPITAKDIFLYLIGKYKSNLATYAALEYTGEIIEILPFYQRLCLCNLGVEIGAKIALIPYDKITEEYLNNKGTKLNNRDFSYFKPDYNAEYQRIIREDISFISPQIALPHRVDNVVPIEEVEDTPINQAVLGTCTQGHIEDLRMAADMLRNNSIKKGVRLLIFPGTRRIYQQALKEGIIEVLSAAGAIIAPPTCGCCVGLHMGIPADNEVIISSANRNFKGRMGNPEAQIFLASTPTVIASAIKGKITHPLKINGV